MWPFSKSQPVAASGILCEMTDYHSHILPGVDDGVKTMNESLQILAEMKHQGVRKVWFTPHIMEDIPNTNAGLRERFQELNLLPVLKRIQTKGYRPLLAHPERYLYMGTSYYCMLKQEQIAFQLNLPSLTGAYGTYIQKKAVSLLKAGMYDLTGTDMHSSKHFKEWLGTRIGSRDRDMLWAHFPACRDGL